MVSIGPTGISVVAHMKNPKIPAFHFNTRFIVTQKNGLEVDGCNTKS